LDVCVIHKQAASKSCNKSKEEISKLTLNIDRPQQPSSTGIMISNDENSRNGGKSSSHQNGRSIHSPSSVILMLFFWGAIGVVSPFAGGSTSDVGSAGAFSAARKQQFSRQGTANVAPHQLYPQQHASSAMKPLSPTNNVATQSSLFRGIATPLASTPASTIPPPPSTDDKKTKSSLFRRIVWNLNPLPGRKDGRWKGGECKATLASRLLFSYVNPLLDVAANRTLTEDDALQVADSQKMNVAVECLTSVYDKERQKSQRDVEAKRQQFQERQASSGSTTDNEAAIKNSKTLVLFWALIKYQRPMLIFTGLMRLLNTGIQAFPAVLVARLLRSIEAGAAEPVSKSVHAALLLVAVLTSKMIVENQYFHDVVSMATQVRGALEGLIFDKSLRLPDGGSGVATKQSLSKEKKALGSGGVRIVALLAGVDGSKVKSVI
jgi:hypothetical protein